MCKILHDNLQHLVTYVLFMYHDYLIFTFYLFHVFSYVQIFVHVPAYDADNPNEYYRISMEGDKARKQHIKHDKEHHTVDGRNPVIAGMYQTL